MGERSILALELCLQLEAGLQQQLHHLVTYASERMSYQEKWQRYQHAGQLLMQHDRLWHRGCWDFWDDSDKAHSDFTMWVTGMLTREGARPHPSGVPDPYRGEPRYLTFTMALLAVKGTLAERAVAAECNIPESMLWQRSSFHRVLLAMRNLSFAQIERDTMYLIPRNLDWGLTAQDLTAEKFNYLRPIV